jgi:hypothetical protein
VALAVDGLNSIDARNTDALSAKKWVLEPYQSIVISGWQVNQRQARRFFFTSEEKSYGQWLGKTSNLGVITAVFFREKQQWDRYSGPVEDRRVPLEQRREKSTSNREADSSNQPRPSSDPGALGGAAESKAQKTDEYAATGIGKRMQHEVQWISMDLDPAPVVTLSLRYEFRPVLVKMGILPAFSPEGPLSRREQARGFKDSAFCPEPR